MSQSKQPLKVFLCHASADKAAVRDLYKRLIFDGVDAWLDAENLIAGQNWQVEIPRAIRESDVVIVCLSEKSINKEGFVQKEIKFALDVADEKPEGTIFIVPVRLEECEAPHRLSVYHWVDLFEVDGYKKIMLALNEKAKRIEADFDLQKEYVAFTSSDRTFVKEIVEELKKQEEPLSFLKRIISTIRNFISRMGKLNLQTLLPKKRRRLLGILAFIALGLAVIYSLPSLILFEPSEPTATLTSTSTAVTFVSKTPTLTVAPLPAEIVDAKSVKMVLVPAGEFAMGVGDGDIYNNIGSFHKVYLDAFYMDIYEVTNALYKECVVSGDCTPPQNDRSFTRSSYYDIADYRSYPVIYIEWDQAQAYCEWRGGSLPTEAQWEKAARGIDGRSYPWGDQFDGSYLNFCEKNCSFYWREENSNDGYVDTAPVGSYEEGQSPYGIYDLAGNVWEWVYDWYDKNYYEISPSFNPLGPASGSYHVVRGGSWSSRNSEVSSVVRYTNQDNQYIYYSLNVGNFIGFRCARNPNP